MFVEDDSVLTRPAAVADEQVAYGEGPDQIADVRFGDWRAGRRPLLLIIHGGFWRPRYDRAHVAPMAEALASAGWTVAAIEYRRIPGNPDATLQDVGLAVATVPAKVACLQRFRAGGSSSDESRNDQSGRAACRYERLLQGGVSHGEPGLAHDGRVVLIGHSAGGHLVLWASVTRQTPQLAGALALAPVADLQLAHERRLGDGVVEAFLGTHPQHRPDLDPLLLPAPTVATTLIHGEADRIVPLEISQSYVSAHPGVRLVRLANTGHFAPIDPLSNAWPAVVAALEAMPLPER